MAYIQGELIVNNDDILYPRTVTEQVAVTANQNLKEKLNEMDANIESVTNEVKDARTNGNTNITYNNLKARLDDEHKKLSNEIEKTNTKLSQNQYESLQSRNQVDFVEFIKNRTLYNRMRFIKDTSVKYSVVVDDGVNFIRYGLTKDVSDDYIKIDDCTCGKITNTYLAKSDGVLTGNFNTNTANSYTTTINDKFEVDIKGSSLTFMSYKDDRGGVWEITIDDEIVVNISTYSNTPVLEAETLIADNLDVNKVHKVVGVFKGADSQNPPSDGVARGWLLYYPTSPTRGVVRSFYDGYPASYSLMYGYSNKEFAFSVTGGGLNDFVPEHGTPCTYNIEPPKFIIDNKLVDPIIGHFYECSKLELIQHCKINANNTGIDIANVKTTTGFTIDGVCNVSGRWDSLISHSLNNAYTMMVPLGSSLNEVVTSFGNCRVNDKSEDFYHFSEEKDLCNSIAAINRDNPNIIVAATVDNPLVTLRQKATIGKDRDTSLRFWQRQNASKLYFTIATALECNPGDSFVWSGRYTMAELTNIYDYIKK